MNMTKVKTADLSGKALAWATWLADRGEAGAHNPKTGYIWTALNEHWSPHSDWSQGGPLIERERIGLWANSTGYFAEKRHFGRHHKAGRNYGEGSTPLIAAMRCLVAANLGDVVSVPEELVQQPTEGSGDE